MLSPGSCLRNEAVDYKQQNVWQQGEMRVEEEKIQRNKSSDILTIGEQRANPRCFSCPQTIID